MLALKENEENRLAFVFASYAHRQRVGVQHLLNDVNQRKGWFLRLIQPYFTPLKDLTSEQLDTIGNDIAINISLVKSYDFLTLLLVSVFKSLEKIEYSVPAGALIEVETWGSEVKSVKKVYNAGYNKVYAHNDAQKVYVRASQVDDVDVDEYLELFLLFGVFIGGFTNSEGTGLVQIFSNGKAIQVRKPDLSLENLYSRRASPVSKTQIQRRILNEYNSRLGFR